MAKVEEVKTDEVRTARVVFNGRRMVNGEVFIGPKVVATLTVEPGYSLHLIHKMIAGQQLQIELPEGKPVVERPGGPPAAAVVPVVLTAPAEGEKSVDVEKAKYAVARIGVIATLESLSAYTQGETRPTVLKAAEERAGWLEREAREKRAGVVAATSVELEEGEAIERIGKIETLEALDTFMTGEERAEVVAAGESRWDALEATAAGEGPKA